MKKLGLLIILIFSVFSLSACGQSDQGSQVPEESSNLLNQKMLRVRLETPVNSIDPAYVQNDSEIMVAKMIFQGLVKEDSEGNVVPCIAKRWDVSPDGLTYTFYLNSGVHFHNGKEITAGDFKFSWERVLRMNAPSSYLFTSIKGAEEVLSGKDKLAAGIVAINNNTLAVTLNRPQDNFVSSLAHPAAAVLDRYEVVEQGINFAKPGTLDQPAVSPSGAGPFQLTDWIDQRVITLGRNSGYFVGSPALPRVELEMNQSLDDAVLEFVGGKIDILQDVIENQMPWLPKQCVPIQPVKKPVREFYYLGMNVNLGPFQNKGVRDAISLGLDAGEILKSVRGESGNVISGYLTDYWYGLSGSETSLNLFRPELAKLKLEEAGYPEGNGLPQITLFCGPTAEDKLIGEKISENLARLGLKLKVQAVPLKDLRRMVKNGEAAIYIAKFSARSPELDTFFSEQINSRWQKTIVNPAWDQLLAASTGLKKEERFKIYRQIEKEVIEDARIRYLFTYKTSTVVSEYLKGFQINRDGSILFDQLSFSYHP